MSDAHKPAAHSPYIPADKTIPELTVRAVVLGAFLGIVFAASSVYLALKVGLTVSASIPIAVLSITIFRAFARATILENNIVQTTGSAGESLAAGIAFTLPALLLMGYELETTQILFVALLGGLVGVFMMIPLRHGLIVEEHEKLPYPEGTACAEVLIVGEKGGTNARTVFTGFGVGILYKLLAEGARLWNAVPEKLLWSVRNGRVSGYPGGSLGSECTPELLGVGYIIGPRIAAVMLAGGVLGYLVIMPAIATFGGMMTEPLYPATDKLIRDMSPDELRSAYGLYIGAGAVATGGIISLLRSLPTIVSALRSGLANFRMKKAENDAPRTARDLSLMWVIGGSVGLVAIMTLVPSLHVGLPSALLILLFGFLFTTVSSRITGEIGSSSNPISGMTVATLLITCLIFLAVGWTGSEHRAMALLTGAIVCVAASNGGTTSQDLKTGYLVGATPKYQQIALLVGVVTSALVIGFTVKMLNDAYTDILPRDFGAEAHVTVVTQDRQRGPDGHDYQIGFQRESGETIPQGRYLVDAQGHPHFLVNPGIGGVVTEHNGVKATKLSAPKAQLFSLIIDGILTRKLPWSLVLIGVFISVMMELCGVGSLAFAVGLYLPLSTSVPIMVGGLVRWLVDRKTKATEAEAETSPGTLMSSGFIAGGAIAGLTLAGLTAANLGGVIDLSARFGEETQRFLSGNVWSVSWFVALAALLYLVATHAKPASAK